jgi:hypothetical protein
MEKNTEFNSDHTWTTWQKIAFRFLFVFLTLQILTENFFGNLFGGTLIIWRLSEKIFVGPCLWFNSHIFHFKYIPQSWTTFSGALHTIRDIIYLLLTCLACVLWTIFDKKRRNYNKLNYWFSRCAIIVLSCIAFAYGVVKLFPVQMNSPSFIDLHKTVGDLSPFDLLWTTFGYGKPYQIFTGFFELSGAVLILFNRTRVAGLLIIASIMLNVVMLNYTYQVGVLITSFYILVLTLFLLTPYAGKLAHFFFTKQPVALSQDEYAPAKNFKIKLVKIIAMIFICFSFIVNTRFACSLYLKREAINHSRKYSLVKNYMVNNDTLRLIENDTVCWRFWSERITDGKRFVTIGTMKPGVIQTYILEQDSLNHHLILHPLNQDDTASLNFSYTDIGKNDWLLDGDIKQKQIKVELQRINPDTIMNLLKTKRTIITLDDESANE